MLIVTHLLLITIFTLNISKMEIFKTATGDLTKGFLSAVKDLDDVKGVVEAYANAYNNEDWDGDISAPGSFMKTVSDNWKKIRVYKNHNRTELIGVPREMDAHDPYGLRTVTQFNMDTTLGKDMFFDVKLIKENNQDADLSIGYRPVKRDKNNPKIITEYRLSEYSFLTSEGANPLAIATSLKGVDGTETLLKALVKMYDLPYSDPRLIEVEKILKSLTFQPSNDTQNDEPIDAIKQFTQSLILKSFK